MTEPIEKQADPLNYSPSRFSVAPMLDWTDRHCRFFHRLMTQKSMLYTEMVHSGAILFGERNRFLDFSKEEHPLALQLGGSDPDQLAEAAKIAEDHGFDEINLNVGCPSDRVQNGSFGACLMLTPQKVADCIQSMKQAVSIPITVKCRIGVDEQNTEEALDTITRLCIESGSDGIIVHARKAWLKGLSPKENRDIPPLDYDRVYRLKQQNPLLFISINGGVRTLEETKQHLKYVDGVMMGRQAYQSPIQLLKIDHEIFGSTSPFQNGKEVLEALNPYIEEQTGAGVPLHAITRHVLGLFNGQRGARLFRQHLSQNAHKDNAGNTTLHEAMQFLE